jgi:hypothetical protein
MARSASRRRRTSRSSLEVGLEAGGPPCSGTALEGLAAATELEVPCEIEVGVGVGVEVARASGARQSCTAGWVAVEGAAGAAVETAICGVAALEVVFGIRVEDRHEGGVARSAPLALASVVDGVGGRFDMRASIAAPAPPKAATIRRAPPIFAPSAIHPAALAVVVSIAAPVAFARIALFKRA